MKYRNIIITGSAGFIGFHLSKHLLESYEEINIYGIDNLNPYYSPLLKQKRIDILNRYKNFHFFKLDFSKTKELFDLFEDKEVDLIIHLGAQPGVRYSLENPWAYEKSNIKGTLNIFELARKKDINKVIYASSSSVYGGNKKIPFSEEDPVNKPISLYAATKRSNELMAYTYHHLYGINMIGLRLFTVYGEYGRPDMATWKFAKNILLDKPIDVYGYGKMKRDFTYISDIVEGILLTIKKDLSYEIFNLGNDNPVELEYFISLLERYLHKNARKNYLPAPPGDVKETWADLEKSRRIIGYSPRVRIEEGLKRFCKWFVENWEWIKKL